MTKTVSFLSALFISGSISAQKAKPYTVEGVVKNYKNNYIYLSHKWDDKIFTDSAKVTNSKFKFSGKTPEPNMYWLTFTNNPNNQPIIFYMDPGKTTVNMDMDSLGNLSIKGGPSQKDYEDYKLMMMGFQVQQQQLVNEYNAARSSNDMNIMQAKQAEFEKLIPAVKEGLKNFVKTHPKSAVSGYVIYAEYANQAFNFTPEETEEGIKALDKSILETK